MAHERPIDSSRVGGLSASVAAALTLFKAAVTPLWDADLWWILRAGQLTLAERAVPVANRFSFTAPTHPWVMHEWLFGVGYALAHKLGGMAAIACVRLSIVASLCAVVIVSCARDASAGLAGVLAAVALLVYGGRFESPRPVGMSALFAVAAVALVFDPRFSRRHALAFAAVMLVWTNAHGSFPLGLGVAFVALFEPTGERRARFEALALGSAATLVNPYGLRMHALVERYVTGGDADAVSLVHTRILEWWPLLRAPLRVASVPELLGAVMLAAVGFASLRERRWRPRAVLILGLLAMALRHNRHLALAGVLGVMLSAAPLSSWLKASENRLKISASLRWMLPAVALSLVSFGLVARARSEGQWVDASEVDESFARLLRGTPSGARVYVSLPFTGWAVLQGASVFFDTRNDCYPREVLSLGFDVNDARMTPGVASERLRALGTSHAVLECDSRVASMFSSWRRTARDGAVCRFEP